MKDKKAYKISIFLAVIGLTLMYASTLYIRPAEVEVGEIKSAWSGKKVIATGEATNTYNGESRTEFLLKQDNSTVKVVKFNPEKEVAAGQRLEVQGTVNVYNGNLQIQASNITQK